MIQPEPSSRYSTIKPVEESIIKMSTQTMATYNPIQDPNIQCRICLESIAENRSKNMIEPCKCSGSVKYVHEECLQKWVEALLKQKNPIEQMQICENGIPCQMCKQPIKFNIEKQTKLRQCPQIKKKIKAKAPLFVVLLILFIVSLQGMSFAIYTIFNKKLSFSSENGSTFELMIALSGIFILFLFVVIGIYILSVEFLVKKNYKVGKVKKPRTQSRDKRNSSLSGAHTVSIIDIQ